MAVLELLSYSVVSNDFGNSQASEPIKLTFGEIVDFTFSYESSYPLEASEILFNCGLFVVDNDKRDNKTAAFSFLTGDFLALGQDIKMSRNESLQARNFNVFIHFVDEKKFNILCKDVAVTADIQNWVQSTQVDNQNRLTASSTQDFNVLDIGEFDTIYDTDTNSRIGVMCQVKTVGVEQESQPVETSVFEVAKWSQDVSSASEGFYRRTYNKQDVVQNEYVAVLVKGATDAAKFEIRAGSTGLGTLQLPIFATTKQNASIVGFDTTNNPPLGSGSITKVAGFYIGETEKPYDNFFSDFETATGVDLKLDTNGNPKQDSIAYGFEQIIWCLIDDITTSGFDVAITVDSASFARRIEWKILGFNQQQVSTQSQELSSSNLLESYRFLKVTATFLNSNIFQNPLFEGVLRTSGSDIVLKIDSANVIQQAKYWLIKYSSFDNTGTFYKSLNTSYENLSSPVFESGNTYTTTLNIGANEVEEGETYYILAVYKDDTNQVASYLSQAFEAIASKSIILAPTYKINFVFPADDFAAYVKTSPLNRVKCSTTITAFELLEVSEIRFNIPKIGVITVVNNNNILQQSGVFQDANLLPYLLITSDVTTYTFELFFRVPESWANSIQEIFIDFTIPNADTGEEIQRAIFKFDVIDFEENRVTPILTQIRTLDAGNNEINPCFTDEDNIRIETTSTDDERKQVATFFDARIREEETFIPVNLPQLVQDDLLNVDEEFSSNIAKFDINKDEYLNARYVAAVGIANPALFFKQASFRFFATQLDVQTYTATEDTFIKILNGVGADTTDYNFQLNSNPALSFTQIQNTFLQSGDVLTITNTSSVFQDATLLLEAATNSINSNSVVANNFADNSTNFGHLDNDYSICFNSRITINSITPSNSANLRYAIRTADYLTENYTDFAYDNLTDLQNAINLLTPAQVWNLHINVDFESNTGGNVTLDFTYQDATNKELIFAKDFEQNTQFRDLQQSIELDGVADYIDINRNLNSGDFYSKWWIDKDHSISCLVDVLSLNFIDPNGVISPFSSAKGDQPNPLLIESNFPLRGNGRIVLNLFTGQGAINGQNNGRIDKNYKNRLVHLTATYKANAFNQAEIKIYVNGVSYDVTNIFTPFTDPSIPTGTSTINIGWRRIFNIFSNIRVSDFIITENVLSEQEIWQIFKSLTNNKTKYVSQYPSNVLNNRVLHYTGQDFTGLQVDDEVNNSTANLIGQATPNLENIYY